MIFKSTFHIRRHLKVQNHQFKICDIPEVSNYCVEVKQNITYSEGSEVVICYNFPMIAFGMCLRENSLGNSQVIWLATDFNRRSFVVHNVAARISVLLENSAILMTQLFFMHDTFYNRKWQMLS